MTANTPPAGNYATVNGLNMYYETHGEGSPLVLIHGGGSTLQTSFGRVLPLLAHTRRVIAVEMQAHGHTGDRDTPESFSQDADDIAALLTHLNISRASVFGFSNGGHTCIELGLRHPDRLNKLIIASAFFKRESAPAAFWAGFDNPDFNHMPQLYKDEYLRINNNPDALMNMFNKDVERMRTFKGWTEDDLRSIKTPSLILTGDKDLLTPEDAVEMYRLLPSAQLAVLPGTHGGYMGEAMTANVSTHVLQGFAGIINAFLDASV